MTNYSVLKYIFLMLALCIVMPLQSLHAAEVQTTILNGKVVSPVTRAKALPFNAIVDEVLVSPGQSVIENQILMTYTLVDEDERILQKEITLGAGTEDTRGQVLTLQRQQAEVIAERNKAQKLAASGLGSKQAFNRIEGDVASLEKRIALLKDTAAKEEANFKQRLDEVSGYFGTTITAGSTLPKKLVLTSPIDGHVLSVATGLYSGTQLAKDSSPITVGKMDPMIIQVDVYEDDTEKLAVGDVAKVTIPSLDDKVFQATVAKIAWTSNNMSVDQPSYFTVELTLPNPDLELKPGFKAVIQFGESKAEPKKEAPKKE